VTFTDGRVQDVPTDEIARYVTEAQNPANALGVERVVVTHRSPDLADGIFLVDTPGIESVHRHNTDLARDVLHDVDAAIFVISADLGPQGLQVGRIQDAVTHKLQNDVVYLAGSGQDEANRRRAMRAIVVSSLGLAATSAFELLITVLSGSVALLSDALHNLGDVFTTVGVYFGFRVSRKQPTGRYPYGYGRAEDLAGIFILLAIWTSAGLAGWQSYEKLVSGRGTTHLSLGMVAAAVGIVGNQLVARYKLRVGRAIKSAPLIVDARHSRLDAVASAGALVGLIGVAAGFRIADPIAGFAITVLIIHIGIDATRDVWSRLMDENDEEVAEAIRAVAAQVPHVVEVSDVRARWLGREVEARVLVRLPATMAFEQAHDVAHRVQETVRAQVPDVREVLVEPAPLTRDAAIRVSNGVV
jgi:cation diffusion facilitator family transporter